MTGDTLSGLPPKALTNELAELGFAVIAQPNGCCSGCRRLVHLRLDRSYVISSGLFTVYSIWKTTRDT
jgi:hypothetical protein